MRVTDCGDNRRCRYWPHAWHAHQPARISVEHCVLFDPLARTSLNLAAERLHIMAELAQLAAPMMGWPARFHADDTRRKCLKKVQQLRPFDSFVEHNAAIPRNPVHLKYILGQIQA
jgi:hypothetical protein